MSEYKFVNLESETGISIAPLFKQDQPNESFCAEFELPESFWETIHGDPVLRQNLERIVQDRVVQYIEGRCQDERARIMMEAKEIGRKKGLQEASEEIERIKNNISSICQEILAQKEKMLVDHTAIWLRTFEHLLKRCLIAKRTEIASLIEEWMKDSLQNYTDTHQVEVRLSAMEYDRMMDSLSQLQGKNWNFVRDTTLSDGEVVCETNDGGIFYSPKFALEALTQKIEEALS